MTKYTNAVCKKILQGKIKHLLKEDAMKISLYTQKGKPHHKPGKPDQNF